MKKIILTIAAAICSHLLYAQGVGINTLKPDPSAALDIVSDNKGLLIPRVELKSLVDGKTINKPAHSLLVYNVNGKLPGGEGYFFNAGTTLLPKWEKFSNSYNVAFSIKGVKAGQSNVYQGVTPNEGVAIGFSQEIYDLDNNYDIGADLFLAPVKGIYQFDIKVAQDISITSYPLGMVLMRTRNGVTSEIARAAGSEDHSISFSDILEAGDQIFVQTFTYKNLPSDSGPSDAKLAINGTYFCGRLITEL